MRAAIFIGATLALCARRGCGDGVSCMERAGGRLLALAADSHLRQSSPVAATAAKARVLHARDPTIVQLDAAFNMEEAAAVLDAAQAAPRAAPPQLGRSGGVTWLPHNSSASVQALVSRVAALVGEPLSGAEKLQVAWYRVFET
jgi:hypothetical protein